MVCRRGFWALATGDGKEVGERLVADSRLRLISAAGSVSLGRRVGQVVAERLAEKRIPAVAENPGPMLGRAICDGKPILSIGRKDCL